MVNLYIVIDEDGFAVGTHMTPDEMTLPTHIPVDWDTYRRFCFLEDGERLRYTSDGWEVIAE